MSDFMLLHDLALANVLSPNYEFYHRSICRAYSLKFHTPLHQVFELPYDFVLLNYYEQAIAEMDEEDVEKLVNKAVNPEWDEDEEKEIDNFISQIEHEEIKKGKFKPKAAKESESLKKAASEPSQDPEPVVRTYDEAPPLEADPESSGRDSSQSTLGLLDLDDLDQE